MAVSPPRNSNRPFTGSWRPSPTNVGRSAQYVKLFAALIRSGRRAWGQRDYPFLFVQPANFQLRQPEPCESDRADLREAQTAALRLPMTAMAPSDRRRRCGRQPPTQQARCRVSAHTRRYCAYTAGDEPLYVQPLGPGTIDPNRHHCVPGAVFGLGSGQACRAGSTAFDKSLCGLARRPHFGGSRVLFGRGFRSAAMPSGSRL